MDHNQDRRDDYNPYVLSQQDKWRIALRSAKALLPRTLLSRSSLGWLNLQQGSAHVTERGKGYFVVLLLLLFLLRLR
jgi:hypothetical protein